MKSEKQSRNFLLNNELIWEDLGNGVSRQIMGYNDQIMMVKVKFKNGAIGYEHKHPHVQTSFVQSGVFELTINGKKQQLEAGEGFYAQPDMLHGAVCLEEGVLIDVFSPVREDFIS